MRGRALTRARRALTGVIVAVLVAPAVALAAFPPDVPPPGSGPEGDPSESVRVNTPDDPAFDRCEPDDEQGSSCTNVFDELYERFGFAPESTDDTARYFNTTDPHVKRLQRQNRKAGRNPDGQVPGVSADRAWKYTTGDPGVDVAILDTGIRWESESVRTKIYLNADELPRPQGCARHDCDGDGFDVDDYAGDSRVNEAAGEEVADGILDGSDLIATFSDGDDDDDNGYVDDISGWDFFDDDNNSFDASSYSSAEDHGTGRAEEAGERGNDGEGGIGVCPRCRVVPMRVWDTFVVDTNNFAQAAGYAADNDIEVVEGAVGALFNSRFARETFEYAYRRGVFFAIVSSDLNTADHNIPTVYDEAMQVQGTVADFQGLGSNLPSCREGDSDCEEGRDALTTFLGTLGLGTTAPIQTWFRNSGTTQYGGHAHIAMPAVTGSAATGQASGAAGLLISYGRRAGTPLQPNEVKQLLTLTSQDVVPENTANGSSGVADPSQVGWDQHFGYGLPDLGLAMEEIDKGRIPPQALITGPDWFAPLNVEQQDSVDVSGRVSARRADSYTYRLQWAPGIEPLEGDFVDVRERTRDGAFEGKLGTIDLEEVRDALDDRPGGGATNDPTAPGKGPGDVDPNEPAFTVRVVVTDSDGNRGEDRKMLFAYRDDTLLPGWSKAIGSGGEASMRMFNLDRGNQLEIVLADSSGRLQVLDNDGKPQPNFNQGKAVKTQTYPNVHSKARIYRKLDPPREVLRTPAIGDIDGDLEPEIVDSAGEHVYAWHVDGKAVKGFPVRLDPDNSRPEDRTKQNHVKRGFTASPTLTDLDGDRELDIFLPALDQHMYAWNGEGEELDGFPVKLQEDGTDTSQVPGAESINTAAAGDITGDEEPDIVAPTNEIDGSSSPSDPQDAFAQLVAANAAGAAGSEGRLYGLDGDGDFLDGWPTKPTGLLPDALPFAGPGVDHAMGNLDGDPELEVVGNLSTGDVSATDGDGDTIRTYPSSQDSSAETVDDSKVINLFENPILAEFDDVSGLEVIKGGVTLNQLVNIGVAVGQNLPYNHVVQAWNAETGNQLPNFPQAVEDFQLLSSPAVADVSDASGQDIVIGTGLYLLRSINSQGEEGDDFPKFTGGWIFAVPAIGDADQDGNLDIATMTREGFAFVWNTDQPACGGNEEWWTSRHDEWSTGAYGTDTRPPGVPERLKAKRDGDQTELTWRAPGDDHLCGQAERYRILASRNPIDSPDDGEAVGSDTDASDEPGDQVSVTVDLPEGTKFVAVLYRDDARHWGMVSQQAKL